MSFLASLSQSLCSKAKGKRQKAKKGRGRSSFSLFPFSFCLPPQLEILEERTLLATLPVPQVSGQQVLLDPRLVATTASVLSPAVAIDPINPNKMVAVEVVNITAPAPAEAAIDLQYSTDGGKTWTDYLFAFGSFAINPQIDPTTITNTNPGVPFVQANFPSVGFDRNENVYVLGVLHNAANNSGAMQFSKFNFSGVFPAAVSLDTTLYGWTRDDPVINASMAVNTNLPTFTDPDTGRVQQDGLAGDIAIVWNTNLTPPSPAPAVFNPSVIKLMVSSDGGNSFTPAVTANDVGTSSNTERDANPQVAFIQGSSSGNLPGGGLILAWNNYFQINTNRGPVNQLIVDASRPGHITSAQFNGTTGLAVGPIGDAGAGTPNVPAVTTLQLPVNITDTNFTTLTDLTVTLNIVHPHLNQLRIELIAPDPNNPNDPTKNGPILRLINEGIDAAGNVIMGQGLPDAANLGVMNGMDEGTILDSLAARSIRDPGATAPYVGTFRPEGNLLNWIQLNGFTRTTINGIWKLRITDMRNDGNTPPVQRVDSWSLNFASSFANFTNGLGLDQSIAFLPGTSTPALNVLGDNNNNYPLKLPVSTTEGIGPGIALAVDNTLGSFSPFSGRAYLAYTFRRLDVNLNPTNNTDIILIASDDGGFSWNALTPSVDPATGLVLPGVLVNDDSAVDGFSEGSRQQFLPSLAVDPLTGTLVVSYYDDRWDASQARVTTYIAASIDGGQTFGPQTYANSTSTATDAITGKTVTIAPIPDNINLMGPTGYGGPMGLAVYGGNIVPVWTGNLNSRTTSGGNLAEVMTANVHIAAGPRVISSQMGPVVNASTTNTDEVVVDPATGQASFKTLSYNTVFASDGTRELEGFVVTFDRPVDVNTFTPTQIKVLYRSPTTPTDQPGTIIAVASVTPLDDHDYSNNYAFQVRPGFPAGDFPNPNRVIGFLNGAPTLATRFLVRLQTPQSAIGTYSYTIGPGIRDRIRSSKVSVNPQGGPVTGTLGNLFTNQQPAEPVGQPLGNIGRITDAAAGNPNVEKFTDFPLGVNIIDPNFVNLSNLTVTLNLIHPHLNQVKIDLIAPDGTTVTLINNAVDSAGNTIPGRGLPDGMNLGVVNRQVVNGILVNPGLDDGTILDSEAALSIRDPGAAAPYVGRFRPENSLALFNGRSAALLNGIWTLRVWDFRNDGATPPDQRVHNWSLNFLYRVPIQSGGVNGPVTSTIDLPGLTNPIASVKVGVSITYPFVEDLRLTLIAPDGTRVVLVRENTTSGANYGSSSLNYTTFDDAAGQPIINGTAPYQGTFRPENPLSVLVGHNPFGVNGTTWTLEIVDTLRGTTLVTGLLNSWTVTVQTGTLVTSQVAGNFMDQNANAIPQEPNVDVYAAPRPVNGFPFTLPYAADTLPLIIPGPHIASTSVPGNAPSSDNLVLNATQSSVDIVFDRDMDPTTITPASILRLIGGPTGVINGPFTVTANPPGTPAALARRTFRIGFPAQQVSGSYSLVLDSTIRSLAGDLIDSNYNAGLDVLRGGNPNSSNLVTVSINSGPLSTTILPLRTIAVPLQVNSNFIIRGATLQLNINYPFDPDLSASLLAPDGTEVKLFSNVGSSSPNPANFSNTVFDDAATTPIQLGAAPFNVGSFNPQTPLSALIGKSSLGTWRLLITNRSTSNTGTVTNFILNLKENIPGSGLGEPVADQSTVNFRIFTQDPTNAVSHTTWTQVGPVGNDQPFTTNRIGDIVVDPSDPSGNTVYLTASDGGGVWKTTNFLTTNPSGPTYIPLLDFGPNGSLRAKNIALFARNNDPRQTVLFVSTGDGAVNSPGIGILRSLDGGASWQILDSTTNVDPVGNILPLNSPLRDHRLSGLTSFKLLVDPTPRVNGNLVLYAAFGGANGGIFRSVDTGKTWQLMRAGDATDIVFVPFSVGTDGNIQRLYAGFRGVGVFISQNEGQSWDLMAGGVGNKLIVNDQNPAQLIPLTGPTSTPNGIAGQAIALAVPALTGSPLQDFLMQNWLYVIVNGTLYVTKDRGQNWTQVALNFLPAPAPSAAIFPSNDNTKASYSPTTALYPTPTISVDVNNANILYIGGQHLLRLDLTRLSDPYAFVAFNNSLNDGGQPQNATTGTINLRAPVNPYAVVNLVTGLVPSGSTPYFNLLRDPNNPFITPTTLAVTNTTNFNNQGLGVQWTFIDDPVGFQVGLPSAQEGTPIPANPFGNNPFGQGNFKITTYRDPLTGMTRLLMATDYGPYTAVIGPDGTFFDAISQQSLATGSRTGNLAISNFNSGAVQPSILAAEIQGGLFYATSTIHGLAHSDPHVLQNGNLAWSYDPGSLVGTITTFTSGTGVFTDPSGSGTIYSYKWPNAVDFGFATDFVQIQLPGLGGRWFSRTSGLIQGGDNPISNTGQWPWGVGSNVVVNPLDNKGLLVSSQAGNIFRSTDQGLNWFPISGNPRLALFDGTYAPALAFGAPDPNAFGNLDDFIYVGTVGSATTPGHIYVTLNGGGTWRDISAGLDGSAVQQIITNPTRGSHEAYAVTATGVFHISDSMAPGATWTNITGNLFSLTHNIFGGSDKEPLAQRLTAIVADWRYSIPNAPFSNPSGAVHPILYVGGSSGVFRSIDNGKTWTIFPNFLNDGATQDGGYLPNVPITSLTLSQGNINFATGQPSQPTGLDLLVATTAGRGMWVIRLGSNLVSGPSVQSIKPTTPGSTISSLDVVFNGPVDPQTFTVADIRSLTAPDGTPIAVTAIQDITPTSPNQGSIHNMYRIFFAAQSQQGAYKITLGPNISDFSGDLLNVNNNGLNGEDPGDTYTAYFYTTTASIGPTVPILLGRNQATGQWSASISNGTSQLINTPFWDLWPTTAHWLSVLGGDFNGDGISDYAGRLAETGEWWVSLSNGNGTYSTSVWTTWSTAPGVTWVDVMTGDFLGNGRIDIAGRWREGGQWWVAVNTGSGFINLPWGNWDPTVNWVNVTSGDFNGDGKIDIIGRNLANGQWNVGISTGQSFVSSIWTTWSTRVTWVDVFAGDFNGDGQLDIAGRTIQGGQWWVGLSNGFSFTNQLWDTWSTTVTWLNVRTGDFNGDGRTDIVGLAREFGQWSVAVSTGTSFTNQLWATWDPRANWTPVLVDDFNGDGKTDIATRNVATGQWNVGLSTGTSFTTSIWGTWDKTITWVDVLNGNFNGDGRADIIGRNQATGQWFVALSTGSSFNTVPFGYWYSPTLTWVDVVSGDFNGDGQTDFAGRVLQTGQWIVSVSNGSHGYSNKVWTLWSTVPGVTWVDILVGDFNGDGKADIAGRWKEGGQWWVAVSDGTQFNNALWTTWSTVPGVTWVDVKAADFNGDGKADIAGRWKEGGQWWVGVSDGSSFANQLWATWNPTVTWVDVLVGDLNGDGKVDLVGRNQATGEWNALLSTGVSFSNSIWTKWAAVPGVTWVDVQLGDFNGDGKLDIVGRWKEAGQWWVGLSDGTKFNTTLWGTWDPTITWVDVKVGDFNGDGKADIMGRNLKTGEWNLEASTGSSFHNSIWGVWDPTITWVSVLFGPSA